MKSNFKTKIIFKIIEKGCIRKLKRDIKQISTFV